MIGDKNWFNFVLILYCSGVYDKFFFFGICERIPFKGQVHDIFEPRFFSKLLLLSLKDVDKLDFKFS